MDEEINEGVQLLLARIDTHPEEFTEHGRWRDVLAKMDKQKFLSEEETAAFNAKLRAGRRKHFTRIVITTLFEDPVKEDAYLTNMGVAQAYSGQSAYGIATGQHGGISQHQVSPQQPQGLLNTLFNKFKSTP